MAARALTAGPGIAVRRAFGAARLILAVLWIIALVGDIRYTLGFPTSVVGNFFSYFTVQSAIASTVVFLLGAVFAVRREIDPGWFDVLRVLVTTYTVSSGLVSLVILNQWAARGIYVDVPWSAQMLHFWLPALALLDWLFAPGRVHVSWLTAVLAVPFPLLWGAYTFIRGPLVGWYPYFFLDPAQVSGAWESALYGAGALAVITGVAALLAAATRWDPVGNRHRHRHSHRRR
ncbi:Pr6Pr family membrane protein [Diaminobutyricimonas sp. LJ205]|uniref:Pr6Pr family membrane protein n=1 Tax=Diaminobutyricimonas sp. LJ205 TaxID=2683590 RepID=UPI0012F4A1AB|nr:Pr6Pr family membrane protein [Diaminobutyricimonas sp. LJ205]